MNPLKTPNPYKGNPNKFTPNKNQFKADRNYNPGIKNDKGRIIAIIFIAGIVYWIYTAVQGPIAELFSEALNGI